MPHHPQRVGRPRRPRAFSAVVVALLTGLATLVALPVSAAETAADTATFSDDFERPDGGLGASWTPRLSSTWQIAGGSASNTAGPLNSVLQQNTTTLGRAWTVSSNLRVDAGANADGRNWVGVAGNIQVASNGSLSYYLLRLTTAARTGQQPNVARWGMFKVTNTGTLTTLADGTFGGVSSVAGHTGVAVTLQRDGSSLKAEIRDADGTVVASPSVTLAKDPTLVGGGSGLYSNTSNLRAKDFTVTTSTPAVSPQGNLICDASTGSYQFDRDGNEVIESSKLGMTWPGMVVLQDLLTRGDRQYVGFYDVDRNLVVAQRSLPDGEWRYKVLDEKIVWDSHNYISLGLDRDGALHVSGNMHNVRLKYFKTDATGDIATLARQDVMVDASTENSVTYPEFVNRKDGSLVFNHRNGGSGSGVTYFNVYDEETGTWSRLVDQPFFNGNGSAANPNGTWNAYFQGPTLGPDGMFHLVWVWRDTPDASTNSILTYAKSEDLVNWVDATGKPLTTPFTYNEGDVVDPIPEREGLLNGNHKIGFTEDGKILISYHKYDEDGHSQLYTATPQGEDWKLDQISDWTGRWNFGGNGTLVFEVQMLGSQVLSDGDVQVDFLCNGSRQSIVIDDDQKPVAQVATPALPGNLSEIRTDYPGMQVNVTRDRGDGATSATPRGRYVLRWESLPENRDLPRDDWPRAGSQIDVVLIGAAYSGPEVEASVSKAGSDGWYGRGAALTLAAGEGATLEYRLGEGPWTTWTAAVELVEGPQTISYRATSANGGVSEVGSLPVKVDLVAPTVTESKEGRTLTLTASDADSGTSVISYRLDDGQWIPYTGPVTVDGESHVITYRAGDVAGNTSTDATATFERVPTGPAPAPQAAQPPQVSGTTRVGEVVRATAGTWDQPGLQFAYQWLRDGQAITGATGSSYRLERADAGRRIAVTVTASQSGRADGVALSTGSRPVANATSRLVASSNRSTVRSGGKITISATVRSSLGRPPGRVQVTYRGRVIRTLTLSNGRARMTFRPKAKGKHVIRVRYVGATGIDPARDTFSVRVR